MSENEPYRTAESKDEVEVDRRHGKLGYLNYVRQMSPRCTDTMNDRIARRISKDLGQDDLTELLAENLSGSELHSLLLAVYKRRVSKIDASQLTRLSPVTKPCDLDGRLLNKLECTALDAAIGFEAIELSPLSPLGAVKVLAGLDQGNVLSTVRTFECSSDPTIGMALECARRRRALADRKETSKFCTNHRVVRFPLPQNPAFTAHFKLFSMVSAGRDGGSFSFETVTLREHIGVYLSLMSALKKFDFEFKEIVVELSDTRVVSHLCSMFGVDREKIRTSVRARDSESANKLLQEHSASWPKIVMKPEEELAQFNLPQHLMMQLNLLEQNICQILGAKHSDVRFVFNVQRLTGLGYYQGPCFHIRVKNESDQSYILADGGFVSWTQALLADSKERLMTSAIGTEMMCRVFRSL